MKLKLVIFVVLLQLLYACQEKNNPEQPTDGQTSISCSPSTKLVTKADEQFVVTLKSDAPWSATADKAWVGLSSEDGQGDAYITIYVYSGADDTAKVLFSNSKGSATLFIKRRLGQLTSEFSISASKKIHFSKGNLQYQASTKTWRFAENQYDYVGDKSNGNVYVGGTKNNNEYISDSYSGWIDLFGWGTGNNPTIATTKNADYTTFVDWGKNAISNGGNVPNTWRTLTSEEWSYLFAERVNASTLFGFGQVDNVNGLILLPDNWVAPANVSFTASTSFIGSTYTIDDNYDHAVNNFSDNTYSIATWDLMESAGAVFLPAAGGRSGKSFESDFFFRLINGGYWSSSSDSNSAIGLSFTKLYLHYAQLTSPRAGHSVRLVRDIE